MFYSQSSPNFSFISKTRLVNLVGTLFFLIKFVQGLNLDDSMFFVIQNNSRMNTMNQRLKPEFKMAC